jgi:uncharacterized protein (DUF885 family)
MQVASQPGGRRRYNRAMLSRGLLVLILIAAFGCSRKTPEGLSQFRDELVYQMLVFSPTTSTQAGYHQHKGVRLDGLLDDYSEAALDAQRRFFQEFSLRLNGAIHPEQLPPDDRADFALMNGLVSLQLVELDEIQNWRHNPSVYVEMIGNGLFYPWTLEYAPLADRYRHIISRLEKIPAVVEAAKRNLLSAPEIWVTVALEENQGNVELADKTLRDGAPRQLQEAYARAAGPAVEALRGLSEFLREDLAKRPADWRLGRAKYAARFKHALQTDQEPEQVLAEAEAMLPAVREEMLKTARPLHAQMYPSHSNREDLDVTVRETLANLAGKHCKPEEFFADARRDLGEARDFVRLRNLVELPARDNLEVVETPEYMRGIYSVGGFVSAPPLEPQLGALYWITPIPKDWPQARIESKLREYNTYGLKLLTLHEAMPGHYIQFETSSRVEPESRRLLRSIYGSGTYIEGWAVYATEMMLEEGYLGNSPELRLTFLKQQLRMLANTVLDIRMQTMGMTDREALDLMVKQCFQESEEAQGKLRRAKLSSCQLPTYFVGWRDWKRVRAQYQRRKGSDFRLDEFHREALAPGAVTLPALARILTGRPLEP